MDRTVVDPWRLWALLDMPPAIIADPGRQRTVFQSCGDDHLGMDQLWRALFLVNHPRIVCVGGRRVHGDSQ